MGLLISTVAKNQFVAGQMAIMVTFLPAFILSGFIFDISSMPPARSRPLPMLIAARYYVAILQTVFAGRQCLVRHCAQRARFGCYGGGLSADGSSSYP